MFNNIFSYPGAVIDVLADVLAGVVINILAEVWVIDSSAEVGVNGLTVVMTALAFALPGPLKESMLFC